MVPSQTQTPFYREYFLFTSLDTFTETVRLRAGLHIYMGGGDYSVWWEDPSPLDIDQELGPQRIFFLHQNKLGFSDAKIAITQVHAEKLYVQVHFPEPTLTHYWYQLLGDFLRAKAAIQVEAIEQPGQAVAHQAELDRFRICVDYVDHHHHGGIQDLAQWAQDHYSLDEGTLLRYLDEFDLL